jgi:flagellar biosynthesis/type III secretory pathway protein FliH
MNLALTIDQAIEKRGNAPQNDFTLVKHDRPNGTTATTKTRGFRGQELAALFKARIRMYEHITQGCRVIGEREEEEGAGQVDRITWERPRDPQDVYKAGYEAGKKDGIRSGKEAGKEQGTVDPTLDELLKEAA